MDQLPQRPTSISDLKSNDMWARANRAPRFSRARRADFSAPVFKATISGSMRDVIASTGKDGLLRLLDRDSKDLIYSVPFTNRLNVEAPVTRTPVRVCPGTLGGQEWNGSAYYAKRVRTEKGTHDSFDDAK